jgi:DNA-binding beta-propeller fold protein YncE
VIRPAAALAALVLAGAAAPAPSPGYLPGRTVPLGAPDRWDYMTFDAGSHRLYVSHLSEITVVDTESGSVVGHVGGLGKSHGVVVVPVLGKGFADDGVARTVTIFDLATLKPEKTLKTDPDPDGMAYDPVTGRVFVINGDGASTTVIDAAKGEIVRTVPLGGQPEFGATDGLGKFFVNIESNREIVRLDTATLAVDARWKIGDCESPHGLAVDPSGHRVFSTCVNQKMVVVDAGDGHVVATLPIGKGSDAAGFDPARKLAFSSNGEGSLTVVSAADSNHPAVRETVATLPGARTMTLDPASGRVFLVTAEAASAAGSKFQAKPGTVKLLEFDPAG